MKYEVSLRFFEDDVNGEWGLAHDDTYYDSFGGTFNAFWNGIGIFHDVFEHNHEHNHKYFRGAYAMNIIGEVAASGHILYYHTIHRPVYGQGGIEESTIADTKYMIQEATESGYSAYGNELLCAIPVQKPVYGYNTVESYLSEYEFEFKELLDKPIDRINDEDAVERAKVFRSSMKFWKIRNAARWGYRRAERMFPRSDNNCRVIGDFFHYWDRFCSVCPASELANYYDNLIFTVTTGPQMKWKAEFRSNEDMSLIDHRKIQW